MNILKISGDVSPSDIRIKVVAALATLAVLAMPIESSLADIPSTDDFYITSGSVVRPKDAEPVPTIIEIAKDQLNFDVLLDMRKALSGLKSSIESKDWDGILKFRTKYKTVLKPFFGYSSVKDISRIFPSTSLTEIESAREDFSFNFSQLSEYAYSHRVIVFNKEDLKLLKEMSDNDVEKVVIDPDDNSAFDFLEETINSLDTLVILIKS